MAISAARFRRLADNQGMEIERGIVVLAIQFFSVWFVGSEKWELGKRERESGEEKDIHCLLSFKGNLVKRK